MSNKETNEDFVNRITSPDFFKKMTEDLISNNPNMSEEEKAEALKEAGMFDLVQQGLLSADKSGSINSSDSDEEVFEKVKKELHKSGKNPESVDLVTKRIRETSPSTSKNESGWWRSKSKFFRLWVFGSIVWTILVILYVNIFEPYGYRLNSDETTQVFFIILLPVIGGMIKFFYDKFVK